MEMPLNRDGVQPVRRHRGGRSGVGVYSSQRNRHCQQRKQQRKAKQHRAPVPAPVKPGGRARSSRQAVDRPSVSALQAMPFAATGGQDEAGPGAASITMINGNNGEAAGGLGRFADGGR